MKASSMNFLFSIVTAFVLLSACSRPIEQKVVARVDQREIHVSDLMKIFQEESRQYSSDVVNDLEGNLVLKRLFLNKLIEQQILQQEADRLKIGLTSEEEKALFAGLQQGYYQGEFEKRLREHGISKDWWMEKQRQKKRIEKLINQEVTAKISVTQQEMIDYFNKHIQEFRIPDQVRCRHIVASNEEKAKAVLALLNKGENFASVAKQYSETPDRENGGDLGYIARGDYRGIFEDACFSLALGQTSGVVTSEYGFHIFRVTDKRPGRPRGFAEVSGLIEQRLREEKKQPAIEAWIQKITSNHLVTIDEKVLQAIPLLVSIPETQETGVR